MMNRPDDKRLAKGLWWDKNWGVLEGCSKVSEGCFNCFAEGYAHRFGKSLSYLEGLTDDKGHWTGKINFRYDQIKLPLQRKKPTVWFVAERGDLFHESVPGDYIAEVFRTMGMCSAAKDARKDHIFLILTKRPERMKCFFEAWPIFKDLPNVRLGVTAENQQQADARITLLLSMTAAKCFVSIEPMLGPIVLLKCYDNRAHVTHSTACTAARLDWVICGGESGSGARPVHPDWVRGLRDQCQAAGIPFFFKQWGEYGPRPTPARFKDSKTPPVPYRPGCVDPYPLGWVERVGKKAAGRLLDGVEYLGWPE